MKKYDIKKIEKNLKKIKDYAIDIEDLLESVKEDNEKIEMVEHK